MMKPILGVAVVMTAAASLTVAAPAPALATPAPAVSATTPLSGATTPALLGVGGLVPDYVIDICRYMPGLPGCPRA